MKKFKLDLSYKTIKSNPDIVRDFYENIITELKEKYKDILMLTIYKKDLIIKTDDEKILSIIFKDKFIKDEVSELYNYFIKLNQYKYERDYLLKINKKRWNKRFKMLDNEIYYFKNPTILKLKISQKSLKTNKKVLKNIIESLLLKKEIEYQRTLHKNKHFKINSINLNNKNKYTLIEDIFYFYKDKKNINKLKYIDYEINTTIYLLREILIYEKYIKYYKNILKKL